MSLILRPGDDPPALTPYCGLCDLPVERYQMDVLKGTDHIGIHAQCCNRTSSTRITKEVYLEMLATDQKLYVIVAKGSHAGLRRRKRHLRSIDH